MGVDGWLANAGFKMHKMVKAINGKRRKVTEYDPAIKALSWTGDLPSGVGPWAELEVALLVVKRKPCDVNLTGGLEDTRRDKETAAFAAHHHVCRVRPVKLFIGPENTIMNVLPLQNYNTLTFLNHVKKKFICSEFDCTCNKVILKEFIIKAFALDFLMFSPWWICPRAKGELVLVISWFCQLWVGGNSIPVWVLCY